MSLLVLVWFDLVGKVYAMNVSRGYVMNVGTGYIIQHHELMNELITRVGIELLGQLKTNNAKLFVLKHSNVCRLHWPW